MGSTLFLTNITVYWGHLIFTQFQAIIGDFTKFNTNSTEKPLCGVIVLLKIFIWGQHFPRLFRSNCVGSTLFLLKNYHFMANYPLFAPKTSDFREICAKSRKNNMKMHQIVQF